MPGMAPPRGARTQSAIGVEAGNPGGVGEAQERRGAIPVRHARCCYLRRYHRQVELSYVEDGPTTITQ